MGFKQTKSYLRISLFAVKVAIGIFGLISDIIYYYTEDFKITYIKDIMAFFILLSPLIQVLAWGILLSEIKMKIPEPQEDERVKNSKSLFQYICNYLYCLVIYYFTILKSILMLLPYTIFVALLQETKVFPVFLFGYTYLKYQAVLTADLMRNISSYLEFQDEKEANKKNLKQKEKSLQKESSNLQQAQLNNQQILDFHKDQIEVIGKQSNLKQISNNNRISNNQDQLEQKADDNLIQENKNSMNILKKMFQNSKRNQLKTKNFMQTISQTNNSQISQYQKQSGIHQIDNTNNNFESNQNLPLKKLQNLITIQLCNDRFQKNTQIINGQSVAEENYLKNTPNSIKSNYDSTYQLTQQQEESVNKFGFSQIDVTLDANLLPTIDTLLIDKNLQQFILITDIVKAIFGALPMTIVKYLNNNLNNRWKTSSNNIDYFILLSFLISLFTILTHGIQLMGILYNDNIKIYYKTLQYLSNMQKKDLQSTKNLIKKQKNINENDLQMQQRQQLLEDYQENDQLKQNQFFGFGKLFPMMKILKINSQNQIKKLNMLRQQACDEVKCMQYNLSNHTFIAANLQKHMKQSLPKFKNLQKLVIKFNNNYFGEGLEEIVKNFLSSMPFLRNIQLSFYQNLLKQEQIQIIYLSINEWMTNNQNQIISVLFETDLAFLWYPSQIELEENQFLFLDKLQEMIIGYNKNDKIIFSVNIPEKTILDDEAQILSQQIMDWINLQKFQLNCKELSAAGENMIKKALLNNQSIQNHQFSCSKNGVICSKGYRFDAQPNKGYLYIQNENFFFNVIGVNILINKQIKEQWKLYLHTINLNFSQENPQSKYSLCESELQALFHYLSSQNFIKNISINLLNNNLGDNIGSIISQSLIQLPKLETVNINFEGNRLTKIGFKDFINVFTKKKKSLKCLELNLNGCQIYQEGAQQLCKYFEMLISKQENQNNRSDIQLQKFVINLTKNRVNQKGIELILDNISKIQSLEYIDLIIKGISLANVHKFDFSSLCYLRELHLTLWYNQFTKDGFSNFVSSFETFPSTIQKLNLDLCHNEIQSQLYPFLNFLNKNNNLLELILNLEGNSNLNFLPNIKEILMDQQRILSLQINLSRCDFDYNSILELKQGLIFLVNLKILCLDFSKNKKFDDDCFLAINFVFSELKTLEEIQYTCQETQITNQSIEAISYQLQTFKKLETFIVDFSNNNIDESMKNLLRQSLVKAKKITNPSLII
ncbi:transmembrane protein, putative (macronuclear) [Tetrahymena thermophila SB210]|uniref:Transmembrane protein, putative n=1 Tax=Tetrahymena thermophila (strain SB210) TaxID=312017 RepID=I7MA27_TETTS|nr:transmembrane protein, putative [Tetrahymena thermophila SB210]EAS03273.2 transmembrane protein, putative [Tetrahymena thermophila SB210]|eukprot:XP_001023518.2 transmembrane protein, putative [Tetrahymena thermophila SB210]